MTGSATYAHQGVADPGSSDGSDHNAQSFLIERLMNQRHSVTLVKVMATTNIVEYGSPTPIKTIDVLPMVNQLDGNGNPIPHTTVYGAPYHRLQGGGNSIICDPTDGDIGIFLVADNDISTVKSTSLQSNPGSGRRGNMADGMYLGSILAKAPTQYFAFTATGIAIADKNGNTLTTDASGWLINGLRINTAGDAITKMGTDLDTHVHTGVTAGSADTGPPLI